MSNQHAIEAVQLLSPEFHPPSVGTRTVTLRIPLDSYYQLQAMSQKAGISMNMMGGKALAAGFAAINEKLPDETFHDIQCSVVQLRHNDTVRAELGLDSGTDDEEN